MRNSRVLGDGISTEKNPPKNVMVISDDDGRC